MKSVMKLTCLRRGISVLLLLFFFSDWLADAAENPTTLVPRRSVWKYHDLNADLGTAWRQVTFDDSGWNSGPGPLGGGDTHIVTTVNIGPSGTRFPTVYFRRSFNVTTPSAYEGLIIRLMRDDGAAVYLNGTLIASDGVSIPTMHSQFATQVVDGANESTYFEHRSAASALVAGVNVLAVEVKNANATSSDLTFDLELEGVIDNIPPLVDGILPPPGAIVLELPFITIIFDSSVTGVDASDLLINGVAATDVDVISPREYTFHFPAPSTGAVQVAWAANHGITDISPLANPFAGGNWIYTLDPNASTTPNLIISEFMADNGVGIRDEDGSRSDWIEILNLGPLEASLEGWFLTDDAANLTKWQFPNMVIQANQYLLVWASEKNRTNPGAPLHTNFRLSSEGEFLALVDPQTNIVSSFEPVYPPQRSDISYGRDRVDPTLVGYFMTPTPGAPNSTSGEGFADEPQFSLASGVYTNNSLTLSISGPPGATIRYTLDGSVPGTSSPVYSTPLTFTTNMTIKARAFVNEPGMFPSRVVSRTFIMLDSTTSNFTSNIPVLILNTGGRSIVQNVLGGQPRTRGSFVVFDPQGDRSVLNSEPHFQGLAEFEIFGQTSAGFPKRPHNIEIQDELGNDLAFPLLGMPAGADWKLRNPYSDKCLMNDFLAAELFEQMGHYSVRRRMVEVFVDTGGGKLSYPGDYYGVMVLFEKIERGRNRVNIERLTPSHTNEPAITGGYIFKKDKDSNGDLNFNTSGGGGFSGQALKMHEPKPRYITTPQLNWLRTYLNRMETALYAANWLTATGTNHYSHYMDVDSFVDQHWIVEFTKQIDGYRLSSYYHKDRNGKVKSGPIWDWNLSFGNADYAEGGRTNGWYYTVINENQHIWLRRLISGTTSATGTTGDPEFNQKIADRWSVLRTNVMNGTNVVARIDEIAAELSEAAVRDFARFPRLGSYIWPNPNGAAGGWHVDYVGPTSYQGIINEMKKWTMGRYLWIDSQFTVPPAMNHAGGKVPEGFTLTLTAAPGATIYYTLDGTDPRAPGGAIRGQTYTGPITLTENVRVFARARRNGAWNNTWSGPTIGTFYTRVPDLRITELMYHPAPPPAGNTNDVNSFEFLEVKNIGSTPLNLNRFKISQGIDFTFSNMILQAGQSAVIVSDLEAFRSRYGAGVLVAGTYSGLLANEGERLVLEGPVQEPILDFTYNDAWAKITDGFGFSLVVVDENAPVENWGLKSSWRAGSVLHGTPGQDEPPAPPFPRVVVNELLANSGAAGDAVELHNLSGTPADVSGWYLTDNFRSPHKFRIPADSIIPAGGYMVFTEAQFNAEGLPGGFAFGAGGEDAYLFSADAGGNLTGYFHGFSFGPSELNVSFGRHVISTGEEHYPAQVALTLGSANSGPRVGPIVIGELMYHPSSGGDQFIELKNITGQPVPLYDVDAPARTWRLSGVGFDFPPDASVPANGHALVVGIDPGEFRGKYSIPAGVPVYGPFPGVLRARGESLRLRKPRSGGNSVTYVVVDQVDYDNSFPWPVAADGIGPSLQRLNPAAYGNDPANWVAAGASPGADYPGGTGPTIAVPPQDQTVVAYFGTTFSVEASGPGPFSYQWRFNGANIAGATNAVLALTNIQPSQAGDYEVVVINPAAAVSTPPARLTILIPAEIVEQPRNQNVRPGTNATFTVIATSSTLMRYQWRVNGVDIPGATNASYTVFSPEPDGDTYGWDYSVVITDSVGPVFSQTARLTVLVAPYFIEWPLSQTVVEGQPVTFFAHLGGTPPFSYRWRRGSTQLNWFDTGESSYTIPSARLTDAGNYTVIVINPANESPGVINNIPSLGILPAALTVLADADGDGMPDVWEDLYGFDKNNPNDALLDSDGDGMTNLQEWIAGTDPNDPESYLRVENLTLLTPETVVIEFNAASNRTFSVQFSDSLTSGEWTRLTNIAQAASNRLITITNNAGPVSGQRYYRLVAPAQP
jgi:hypothetical protein